LFPPELLPPVALPAALVVPAEPDAPFCCPPLLDPPLLPVCPPAPGPSLLLLEQAAATAPAAQKNINPRSPSIGFIIGSKPGR
jgi:hypothetical protein